MPSFPCTLLVDDNDTTNFLNELLLLRAGITQTLKAQTGQEALDLLRTHCGAPDSPTCPALILLDLRMPTMDGFEFLQAYAQQVFAGQTNQVIIMLTSSLHPQDVARIQNLPIAGYLTKPLTAEKIRQVLQEHFGHPSGDN
jgi:CheY-like chemotaxis protein